MSTLHVLMPPLSCINDVPAFQHWLGRGDRLPDIQKARVAVLRERFQFTAGQIPAAALRHHCHASDAANDTWVCADPAYVRSEATGARLLACPVDGLSGADADELAAALQPLFDDMEAALLVDTPSAWSVRLASDTQAADFTDAGEALGASLIDVLPEGDAGRAWRRLFNDAQILLHAHPVNTRRAAAGKVPVNALWFWGGGRLPDSVETGLQCVASTDDVLRGLARMAGAVRLEPSREAMETARESGDALLDLDMPGHKDVTGWLAPFEYWLREHRFDGITLVFASGERFRLRHAHRLRFWVRRRDLPIS